MNRDDHTRYAPRLAGGGRPTPALAGLGDGRERPVFYDGSGRRARWVRHSGRLALLSGAAWMAALVLGAMSPVRLPTLALHVARTHALTSTQALVNRSLNPALRVTATPDTDDAAARRA